MQIEGGTVNWTFLGMKIASRKYRRNELEDILRLSTFLNEKRINKEGKDVFTL